MLKGQVTAIDLPLQGMTQLQMILDIVKNETTYNKKLKGLNVQLAKLVELIETVGKVEAIEELKNQAKIMTEKLNTELSTMQTKKEMADDIVSQAKLRSVSIESDASSRLNEQKEVLDRREKELSENRKQLNEREVEVRKAEASVTRLKLAAQAELDRLKQLQEVTNSARIEFENRKDKLERALSGS